MSRSYKTKRRRNHQKKITCIIISMPYGLRFKNKFVYNFKKCIQNVSLVFKKYLSDEK